LESINCYEWCLTVHSPSEAKQAQEAMIKSTYIFDPNYGLAWDGTSSLAAAAAGTAEYIVRYKVQ